MRKIALILALLVSSAVPGRAQRETSAFVGHFGHIITYSPDWAVTARMIGEAEEIRFHPRRFYTATDSVPFQPKAEDFKVEKFTPLHLMTLMIVPRSASSFADISDLKRAKIADLEGKTGFRIIDNPPPGGYWPEGSFEVRISTPYRLRQLYVFNDSYRFILTWGEDSAGTEMSDVSGLVKTSLSKMMKLPEKSEPWMEPIAEAMAQDMLVRQRNRMGRFVGGMTAILLVGLVLSGRRPGSWAFFRGAIGSAAFCAFGAAALGASLEWAGAVKGWNQSFVAIPALFPWIPAAARLAYSPARRFRYLAPGLSALAVAWLLVQNAPDYQVTGLDAYGCAFTGYLAGFAAWISCAVFSLSFRRAGIIPLAALMMIPFGPRNAHAQTPQPNWTLYPRDVLESKAWSDLAQRGINRDNIRNEGRNRLKASAPDEPLYDLQSVEVAGMGSNDDTESVLPDAFDATIKPTARARRSRIASAAIPWIEELANIQQDARDAKKEIAGMLSNAGKSAIAPLLDQEVNRIVAHSWGTEIIYNAIFYGVIKPPRVLIILGPPDRNAEKWRILAERTGTQVMVFRADGDPVPEVGGMFKSSLSSDPTVLNEMWDKQCADIECKPHPRRRGDYSSKMLMGVPGHGRKLYYDRLVEMGVLGSNLLDVQLAQEARITAAADSILEAAVAQAQETMMKSREESIARTDGPWKDALLVPARPIPGGYQPPRIVGTPVGVGVDQPRMLRSLAIGACTQPEAVNDGVVGNINLWFPDSSIPEADKFGEGLTGCSFQLYRELVEASRTWNSQQKLTVDWVKARAYSLSHPQMVPNEPYEASPPRGGKGVPPTPDHDPVWGRIGPIIGR